jgi:hypothetical protein
MGWEEGEECSWIDLAKKEPKDVYFLLLINYHKI